MKSLAAIVTGFVALSHLGFLILEMFLWERPIGQKIFDLTPEFAAASAPMAANQGLYNGFLFAGLIWGLIAKKPDVQIFFLACVVVAGIFGAVTVSPTIFFVQAVPAILAMGFVVWSKKA